jgi:tight adherence protein C
MDYLPSLATAEPLIIALAALSAVMCAFFVYRTVIYRDPMESRLKSINARREALKAGLVAPVRRRAARREQSMGLIRRIITSLNILRSREANKVVLRLSQAGWRAKDAVVLFFFFKLCLPFVLGAVAVFAVYVLNVGELESVPRLVATLFAVVVGAYGPDIYVKNAISKRRQALQKGLPDALDLLVICAEAGQSLDGALKRVARELGVFCPELADEIGLTAAELGLLPNRRDALENLNMRTAIPSIRGVVNTLLQTEKYGTPLAHSLRVLAAEFRSDRMMKAEEKAARLPALLTVPMIMFILPPLFIVLIGPAVLRVMDVFAKL